MSDGTGKGEGGKKAGRKAKGAEAEGPAGAAGTLEVGVASESSPAPIPEILAANDRFYAALSGGDLPAMTEVWLHSRDAMCIHPSGLILREWDDIVKTWEMIFKNGAPKVIAERDTLRVTIREDVATVFCVERILSQGGMGLAACTNIFQRVDGGWKMFWHQSALLPSMM